MFVKCMELSATTVRLSLPCNGCGEEFDHRKQCHLVARQEEYTRASQGVVL
jgi:hypothetical protein